MKVGDLDLGAFAAELGGSGVPIRCGPFVTRIVSELPELAGPLQHLYNAFPIASDELVDFHVRLHCATGLYHRVRPRVVFSLDGEQAFPPALRHLALPLLEWGLNWCVYTNAHQYLVIHAAAVQKGDTTCLLPAVSGSGKSTLCAALVSRGWRLLSDELAILRPGDGNILPIARPISLKNESIEVIRAFAPDQEFGPLVHATPKGLMTHMKPPSESVRSMDDPAKPTHFIFPSYSAETKSVLSSLKKSRAFLRAADCSTNYAILGRDGFDTLADCIEACDCYEFSYSSLDDAIRVFDNLV